MKGGPGHLPRFPLFSLISSSNFARIVLYLLVEQPDVRRCAEHLGMRRFRGSQAASRTKRKSNPSRVQAGSSAQYSQAVEAYLHATRPSGFAL